MNDEPAQTIIKTSFGKFDVQYFKPEEKEIVTFSYGDISSGVPIVRIHSSCLFGESFHSEHCDCAQQLTDTMRKIVERGSGVIVYVYEEGRGVGLKNKIRAMEIERVEGFDTVDAFAKLGFEADPRDFTIPAKVLKDLDVSKTIGLYSGNPKKRASLEKIGFEIIEEFETNSASLPEIAQKEKNTKRAKMGYSYGASYAANSLFFYEDKHYELSNFSAHSVEFNGVVYMTCEHAYQCQKFDDQSIKDKIMEAKSSFLAKKVSRENSNFIRNNWNSIRLSVMENILRAKASQHKDVHDSLLNTGDNVIHENSPTDLFWGCGVDMSGESNVGKIWMKIRAEIKGR